MDFRTYRYNQYTKTFIARGSKTLMLDNVHVVGITPTKSGNDLRNCCGSL